LDFKILRIEWLCRAGKYRQAIEDSTEVLVSSGKITNRARGLRSLCYAALGETEAAEEDLKTFHRLLGDEVQGLNSGAYSKVGKDISLRHPWLAQLYVDRIRSLTDAWEPMLRDTLGLVLYRNDRYQEAIEILQGNLDESNECYAEALSVTAMCHAQLGDMDKALECYQRAEAYEFPDATPYDLRHTNLLLQREARQLIERTPIP
jgi:tetratricopeptide (TPR) repeat protein